MGYDFCQATLNGLFGLQRNAMSHVLHQIHPGPR